MVAGSAILREEISARAGDRHLDTEDEAVRIANDTEYGLAATCTPRTLREGSA